MIHGLLSRLLASGRDGRVWSRPVWFPYYGTGFLLVAAMLAGGPALALEIADVRVSRIAFDPAQGESTEIRFNLSQAARAELLLYDGREVLIRRLAASGLLAAGEHWFTWDGADEKGQPVSPEAYHYVIRAWTEDGKRQIYDLTDLTGGEPVTAQDVSWDKESGRIRYRLPAPARVNIRVGMQNFGPLLATVVEWVPRPGGIREERWNGWDGSNVLDLSDHPRLHIAVDAYSLSDNTLRVGPPPAKSTFVAVSEEQQQHRESQASRQRRISYHARQPLEARGDVEVTLTLPAGLPTGEDGLPVVSGVVPIRLDVRPEERQRVIDRRFEPVFYVDGVFAFENEVGYLPFTWLWNAGQVNDGIHYISANLLGYTGNFGMATLKVRVQHAPQETDE